MQPIFKIRDPKTGWFSTGGDTPRWAKTGKVWKRPSDLSSHFTQLSIAGKQTYTTKTTAEVVRYDMVPTETTPASDHIAAAVDRAAQRIVDDQKRISSWREQNERRTLVDLVAKYGIPK